MSDTDIAPDINKTSKPSKPLKPSKKDVVNIHSKWMKEDHFKAIRWAHQLYHFYATGALARAIEYHKELPKNIEEFRIHAGEDADSLRYYAVSIGEEEALKAHESVTAKNHGRELEQKPKARREEEPPRREERSETPTYKPPQKEDVCLIGTDSDHSDAPVTRQIHLLSSWLQMIAESETTLSAAQKGVDAILKERQDRLRLQAEGKKIESGVSGKDKKGKDKKGKNFGWSDGPDQVILPMTRSFVGKTSENKANPPKYSPRHRNIDKPDSKKSAIKHGSRQDDDGKKEI